MRVGDEDRVGTDRLEKPAAVLAEVAQQPIPPASTVKAEWPACASLDSSTYPFVP